MKKKFFTLFSATLATLALALLSSCSGITSPSEPEAATAHQAEGLSLRGTFSMAEATAEPSLKTITPSSSQRNAIPTIGSLTYSVKAFRQSDGATKWADVDQGTKSYEFRNTLSSGTWQITAYAKQDDITILQSETTTITLSKDRPDASANLALAPSTEGSGTIALTVSWASGTGISWVTYNCPAFSPGENQGSGYENSYTLSDSNVAAGIYPITISFYKSMESTIPLYSCTEYIAVYPELTTNQWTKSTAPHISSSGQFIVTADCVKTFVYRSVYLSSSGNNDTANGTSERPYKTAGAAMARLTELASTSIHSISETNPWELHVVGTIKASSIAPSSKAFIDVPSSIGFLKIVGEGSGATLDADQKGRVLYVQNGANVTIQNITLKKGSNQFGAGVYVLNGGTFTIQSGTITGNTASRNGGGVFVDSGATFNMNGGSITGNTASGTNANGGGLILTGTINITGGSITGNTVTGGGNGNNVYIGYGATGFPNGDNAFYDDTTTSNGKADAVCMPSSNQFARFNNPGSGTTDFQSFVTSSSPIFSTSAAATFYLGNSTDSTAKTWKSSTTIVPDGVLTIASSSTTKHTVTIDGNMTSLVETTKDFTLKKTILQGNSNTRCIWCKNGKVTMEGSTLKGGGATPGAGLYIAAPASGYTPEATIDENSTVEGCDNSSKSEAMGGGIFVDKGSGSSATLTLSGTVSGCTSKNGGGIYLKNGSVTLKENAVVGKYISGSTGYASESTDGRNMATENGGGVYVHGGTFTMEGSSKVSFNLADNNDGTNRKGGGIYTDGGTVNIGTSSYSSPSVCNNHGTSSGGGIYVASGGKVNLYGSIKYNLCNNSCGGAELIGGNLDTYSGSVISNNSTGIAASGHHGCGVVINDTSSTLYMYGGSITGNKTSSNNTTYDVSIETSGYLKMEGNANAGKVCTKIGTAWIYVKGLTASVPATITPVNGFGSSSTLNYDTSKQVIFMSGTNNADFVACCAKFAVEPDASGNLWKINSSGKLVPAQSHSHGSGDITITDDSKQHAVTGSGIGQLDIINSTSGSNYTVFLTDFTKEYKRDCSALRIINDQSSSMTVHMYLGGTNSVTGANHGGLKLCGTSGTTHSITLILDTTSAGSLTFDSPNTNQTDLQIENVSPTFIIADGCTFTGTVGSRTYTDPTAFFNAAKTNTSGSTITLTRP